MKVRELIEILKGFPEDLSVCVYSDQMAGDVPPWKVEISEGRFYLDSEGEKEADGKYVAIY